MRCVGNIDNWYCLFYKKCNYEEYSTTIYSNYN